MKAVPAAFLALLLLVTTVPSVTAEVRIRPGEGDARENWTWTWMDGRGLGLGGGGLDEEDIRYIHEQGFRAVINFREEFPDNESAMKALDMEYLYLPTTYAESDTMPLEHLHLAVDFIERNLAAGRPVYVHCIGGWHRSAAGVVAYLMKTNGWRFEPAWDHAASLRPGIEPRFSDVLYEYEAELFGDEKLTLDLWTERWDVVPGETVNVTGLVTRANGTPVAGASVQWDVEYKDAHAQAVSDKEGRVRFQFTAEEGGLMQYVHAVARKDGFVPGYDRNLYWVKTSKTAPPTVLDAPSRISAEPGAPVRFEVAVTTTKGEGTNGRVTVVGACGTHFRAYTGWDGRMEVAFLAPLSPGEYPITLRATRFPAEPVTATATLVIGAGGPAPPCDQWRSPAPLEIQGPPEPPAPSGVDGRYSIPAPSAFWSLLATACVGALFTKRRMLRT